MNINNIIRAWKDESFRLSLTAAERALLPENPAGLVELSDSELGAVNGAEGSPYATILCTKSSICACPSYDTNCPWPDRVPQVPPTKKKG